MHYIRLLRQPVVRAAGRQSAVRVELVLSITTDLGDAFLFPDAPVALEVVLLPGGPRGEDGAGTTAAAVRMQGARPLVWSAGSRVLKGEFSARAGAAAAALLCVRPADARLAADGRVVPVYAELWRAEPVALRRLRLPGPARVAEAGVGVGVEVEVEEDLGESIARHVWDAGVRATGLLGALCGAGPAPDLPGLRGLLRAAGPLHAIEVGCGVGVLGLALAAALARAGRRGSSVLLTDLPEARARALANMARYDQQEQEREQPVAVEVEYEDLDWEDGRRGELGPRVAGRACDLVLVSDCTYNVDMLPALVATLTALHRAAAVGSPRVLLATKPRHESERALLGLMGGAGWAVAEETVLPLPVLGGEDESVEVYVFAMAMDGA